MGVASGKKYWLSSVLSYKYWPRISSCECASQNGQQKMLNFFSKTRTIISLNLSRLFHRWSYGVLLYEIFTIGKLKN